MASLKKKFNAASRTTPCLFVTGGGLMAAILTVKFMTFMSDLCGSDGQTVSYTVTSACFGFSHHAVLVLKLSKQ